MTGEVEKDGADLDAGRDMAGVIVAGDLTIVRRLAEGGMGAVYVALQKSTGKERALKLMHRELAADPDFQRRFEQEARAGARIRSEHVVEVLAAGVDGPTRLPYLVMELLEGEDLRHRIARGPLAATEAGTILEQMLHAIAAAHTAGVVHRDIKPENVFLAQSLRAGGAQCTVKMLDFGIAKLVLESSTRASRAVGSPMWMAPEQTAPGPVTASADVWAIGLVAYEMLTGKTYWHTPNREGGNTVQLLREIVLEPLPAASLRAGEYGVADRLPPGFDAWFSRCVAREPTARFADASSCWRALPPSLTSLSTTALADTALQFPNAANIAPTAMSVAPPNAPIAASTPTARDETPAETPATTGIARSAGIPPETPIALAQKVAPARGPMSRIVFKIVAMVCGTVIAVTALREVERMGNRDTARHPSTRASAFVPAAPSSAEATPLPSPSASEAPSSAVPSVTIARAPPPARAPVVLSSSASPSSAAPSSAAPEAPPVLSARTTIAGGFSDPMDRNGPYTTKIQDHHVRLLVRLSSNETNIADAAVRNAIESSSWRYMQCYKSAFGNAKELPQGMVSIGFEIKDQLPHDVKVTSSTFTGSKLNDCMVQTVIGQTINAAGAVGKGRAVESFRFIPN